MIVGHGARFDMPAVLALAEALAEALAHDGPALIDIIADASLV